MKLKPQHTTMLDSREALTEYLDALFHDPYLKEPLPQDEVQPEVESEHIENQISSEVESDNKEVQIQADVATEHDTLEFVIIQVDKYRLALPLLGVKTVIYMEERNLTRLPEQAADALGIIIYENTQVQVHDVSWLFNSNHKPKGGQIDDSGQSPARVIILEGNKLALACDYVHEIVKLDEEQVRWHRSTSKNPWLKGVIIDSMVPILDLVALKKGLKNRNMA